MKSKRLGKTPIKLKTPINYYGSKNQLLPKILPLIPEHSVYVEPFFGGGALYFAKEPVRIEAINDINGDVINFYKTAKREFEALKLEIDCTLFSEEQHAQASDIYNQSEEKTSVLRAWSLFVLTQQSFLNILGNSWRFDHTRNIASTFQNKKDMFDERYLKRFERTQIFCRDANRVLLNMDCPEAFHFIDPPYINTNCGHYEGYTEDDFKTLLSTCEKIEGKFLLTTFPSEILSGYENRSFYHELQANG
ncbi:DNA adenine methylase [Arcicella sp. LKC2W]|uniref:DNA adenine methylase n=1 Tax=Arcicella sp. LKC2W TaxID=2984198 RepID=UPI002B216D0F|nr:DNA adenine methylase [Arcicella sp. LKC2W]MEA5461545.1 DNA adenine methylase [Arcicella sp. LKC2W]